jgi:hypothetical protein
MFPDLSLNSLAINIAANAVDDQCSLRQIRIQPTTAYAIVRILFRRNLPQKFRKSPITADRWHILQHCAHIAAAH